MISKRNSNVIAITYLSIYLSSNLFKTFQQYLVVVVTSGWITSSCLWMCCAAGPPAEAWRGSKGLLRSNQTQPHFRPLLWRQQQCHPQEAPQHGCEELRMPMSVLHVLGHSLALWNSKGDQRTSSPAPHNCTDLVQVSASFCFCCKYFSELSYLC